MSKRRGFQVLLMVVATVCLLVFSGIVAAQGNSENAFERVREVQERHTDALMAKAGVVGTAVGLGDDDNPAMLVLLEHGAVAGIPAQLDGVKVKKMVTGKIYARADTTRYNRPVPIGVSTGHPAITAGTIGCRVTDGTNVYALSNNHVFADENRASIGDNVLQPGAYDGGVDPGDEIGKLSNFEPIDFSGGDNTIDAAIASTTSSLVDTATPADGYGTPSSTPVAAKIRMRVQKRGRTTELTKGRIAGIYGTVNVGYDSGVARFVNQIVISPGSFSAGGDSGSLIVTQGDNNPVGLLFAGSSSVTIANPIQLVLDRFEVTVDDGSTQPPDPPDADFSGTPTSGDAPLTVNFTDLSTGDPTRWSWDFGDGGTSTAQNPSPTYTVAGTYTVSLIATNADGSDTETKTGYITVSDPGAGPMVENIDPATLQAGGTYHDVTITGSGFSEGASVTFENGAGPAPEASNVLWFDEGEITATVTVKSGGPPRRRSWDVRVTSPDGSSGVLVGGLTIDPQSTHAVLEHADVGHCADCWHSRCIRQFCRLRAARRR